MSKKENTELIRAKYDVTFQPEGIHIRVAPGYSVIDAANEAGVIINNSCGSAGTCGKCLVEIDGVVAAVRACQTPVDRHMVVTIPNESRFFAQKILQTGIAPRQQVNPAVRKIYVRLDESHLGDLRSDWARLADTINNHRQPETSDSHGANQTIRDIRLTALAKLPIVLREHDYHVTAVCRNSEVIAVEPGDTTGELFGVAVDVGTTTVVAYLIDLLSGKIIDTAAKTNPQVSFGDDVISRIEYTRAHSGGLKKLQQCIIECLNELVNRMIDRVGIAAESIYEMSIAGNTTMQHLFAGIPVTQIAQAPYISAFSGGLNLRAGDLGLAIQSEGTVYIMPGVAAHVGGDAAAVAAATGLNQHNGARIAIDIGTNGEIVMSHNGRLTACSTAAGPAFEGARIHQGMRGSEGAIERVRITDGAVECQTIGHVKPVGICGSGLIDAVAELLNAGILESSGRLPSEDAMPDALPLKIRERIIDYHGSSAFVLVHGEHTQHGNPIVLTQRDIREVQLGKAAIAAGFTMLAGELEVDFAAVDRIYLAGAFGNYIHPGHARRIGLLPPVPLEKIQFVGNAAGTGAIEALCSRELREYNASVAANIEYVELAGKPDFMRIFSDMMFFPEK